MLLSRRHFLRGCAATSAAATAGLTEEPSRFFTVAKRNGRWPLIAPGGAPFFSVALNYLDPSR